MTFAPQPPSRSRIRTRRITRPDNQLRRRLALLAAIDGATDIQTALHTAADGIRDLLGAPHSFAILFDDETQPFSVLSPADHQATGHHWPDPSLLEHIQHTRGAYCSDGPNYHHTLIVALRRDNDVIGALGCVGLHKITQRASATAETIAAHLTHTLERHYLRRALQRRTRELAAICDTAITVSSQIDLPTTLHSIVEQAVHLVGASGGLLFLCDEVQSELEVVVSYRLDQDYCGRRLKLGAGLAGRASITKRIECVADYQEWISQSQQLGLGPFRAALAVPLLHENHVLGVIDVLHDTPAARFSEDDIAIVQLFATQAVVAISNARLYDQAHQHAARTSALARASQLLDAHGDMSASIQPLAEASMNVLGAQACLVMLADSTHDMVSIGLTNTQVNVFSATVEAYREQGACSGVLENAAQQIMLDPITPLAAEHGFGSTIALLLARDEQVLGCMLYFYQQRRRWDRNAIELAHIVANQMTAMVANARLYREVHLANQLKAEFVSTVSHELRTPMGAIMGYTELIASGLYGTIPAAMHEPLGRVKSNAEHLLAMINQMLDLTRIEARRLELHNDPFNPRDLLESVVTAIEPLAVSKGLAFSTSVAPDVPTLLLGDVGRLRQMLINLAGNSVKFTPQGRITIECTLSDEQPTPLLQFTVTDTGVGISSEHLTMIWEPFRQVDSSATREFGGTGLGLAIVRKLAELMQGTATVTSALGVGSAFTITLPLLQP